jgi:hypothetical protein
MRHAAVLLVVSAFLVQLIEMYRGVTRLRARIEQQKSAALLSLVRGGRVTGVQGARSSARPCVIPSREARNLFGIVRVRDARKRFLATPLGMTPALGDDRPATLARRETMR